MLSRALNPKKLLSPLSKKGSYNVSNNNNNNTNSNYNSIFSSLHPSEDEEDWGGIGGNTPLTFCAGGGTGSNIGLQEVLRSSVQVLGTSGLGVTEKVVLIDGSTFVAKRFRKVAVGRTEFGKRVEKVAAISWHCEYLVPVRAHLYAKRTKLVLCNYYPMGSLADLLQGVRDLGHTPLNWKMRPKIILHVARAMAYVHSRPPAPSSHRRFRTNVHGNIKSSNVLVTTDFSARLSDFGFLQLARKVDISNVSLSKKPGLLPVVPSEVNHKEKPSQKGDVFSFGVVLLEVLGGARAPHQVHCIMERMDEIKAGACHFFDYFVEGNAKAQALKVLEVALDCIQELPEQRPSADHILALLTDALRTRNSNANRNSTSSKSIG